MTHLVDSDWVIDWLKGRKEAVELLTSVGAGNFAISLITYGAIYEGIYFPAADSARHEQVFLQFLRGTRVLPLPHRSCAGLPASGASCGATALSSGTPTC